MEKTHEGVHEGAVHIPKNADRIQEFVNMDTQFHKDLESLAGAAGKNDKKAMLDLTKKLLDGCVLRPSRIQELEKDLTRRSLQGPGMSPGPS